MVIWQGGSKKKCWIDFQKDTTGVLKVLLQINNYYPFILLLVSIGSFLLIQNALTSVIVYASIHKQYTDAAGENKHNLCHVYHITYVLLEDMQVYVVICYIYYS